MNKIIIIVFSLLALGLWSCDTDIEPIDMTVTKRTINTEELVQYKSNLSERQVVMGMLYGWGTNSQSNLMHTPDKLDVVVVKEGYMALSDYQKKDLSDVQTLKATRVLVGVDFETMLNNNDADLEVRISEAQKAKEEELKLTGETLSEAEVKAELDKVSEKVTEIVGEEVASQLMNLPNTLFSLIEKNGFDGVSVEVPQSLNDIYTADVITKFIETLSTKAGKGKEYILVVENPLGDAADAVKNNANWVVFRNTRDAALLANFDKSAKIWVENSFLPSVDFTDETLQDGFEDSSNFSPNGSLSQIDDILNWSAANQGGVAFYHIEKDYNTITDNVIYATLESVIRKMQAK